jgi:hypothetical protein
LRPGSRPRHCTTSFCFLLLSWERIDTGLSQHDSDILLTFKSWYIFIILAIYFSSSSFIIILEHLRKLPSFESILAAFVSIDTTASSFFVHCRAFHTLLLSDRPKRDKSCEYTEKRQPQVACMFGNGYKHYQNHYLSLCVG